MRSFREISEAKGDTAVFTFGRFNPPTTGHEKLIDALARESKKVSGSKMYVFASHSQDPKKNPLPYPKKIAYMKKMFPKYKSNITTAKQRNVFEVATFLHDKGHRAVVMVVGSDRVDEFDRLLNEYNGVQGRHGYYGFDSIEVVSAGERDPDAEGVEGMSASKMRAAAAEGEFDQFKQGLPSGFKDAKKLFRDVLAGMGIREERDMGKMTDYEELRDAYLTNKIWRIDDLVEANGVEGRIVRRGTNYISYMDGSGKVHKAWLQDIALNERNYRKEYDNYHSRPEQIEKRSSRNKARRAMGDNAVKGMDVGHKDNNPLNNDPDNLRNEDPSTNRREPRLREEEELDEKIGEMAWYRKVMAKIDQMTHPRGFEKMVKQFADRMAEPKNKDRRPSAVAADVAREYDVSARAFIQYTNKLVQKGVLPKQLKAEVQNEMVTFKELVTQINEVKQDADIKKRPGTQPAKYYAKDTEGDAMAKSTKQARARHFAKKKTGPAPGDASATTKPSKHTKKFKQMYGEEKMECPPATKDLALNTKNRDATTKKYNYGPLNVDEPGDYWKNIAKHWKTTEAAAKKSVCANCVAFDISERMKECLPGDTFDDDGELGYCWMHHFKCHSARACHTWAKGGPIKDNKESYEWQKKAFGKSEKLGKDADAGDYIKDFQKSDAPQFKGKSKEKRKDMAIAAYLSKNEEVQLDEKIAALVKKAEKSGMPYSILKKVYDRGMAAYKTGHRPGATPQQWALARVNSFTTKSSGTWGKADKDLAKQVRGEGLEEDGPCWDTHKQVGMKKKGGKMVPNCVPKNEDAELNEWGEVTEKAEYNGRPVDLNNPTKGDVKKYKVYVKNEKGNVVKVEFGDPNMEIKRDDPGRRANFRARHNCDNPGPKYKARYWSCKFWSAKSVTDLMKG